MIRRSLLLIWVLLLTCSSLWAQNAASPPFTISNKLQFSAPTNYQTVAAALTATYQLTVVTGAANSATAITNATIPNVTCSNAVAPATGIVCLANLQAAWLSTLNGVGSLGLILTAIDPQGGPSLPSPPFVQRVPPNAPVIQGLFN